MGSAMLIKTSYPPQARLAFVLGDTEYRALVTLRNVGPEVAPAAQRQGSMPQPPARFG